MARGPVNVIETHIEKGLLGGAGLLLLGGVIMFLIRSPNTVEYQGRDVGAGELGAAIQRDAESLQDAVDRGKPPNVEVPEYSKALAQDHEGGIFAAAPEAPRMSPTLRLTADFGREIPSLADETEAAGDVVLVTPLRPSAPVLRTGRVLAVRQTPTLGEALFAAEEDEPDQEPDESLEPTEFAWVSAASYFSRKAQQDAMTNAGYATYRTRAYVVGVDAQRQEMLASAEWSEWGGVTKSKAMPRLPIPEPLLDEDTGEITNNDELKAAYTLIKASQVELMQPPFYNVDAGDDWKMPPLPGYEEREEEEDRPRVVRPNPRTERERRPAPARTGRRSTGRRPSGTASVGGVGGPGGGMPGARRSTRSTGASGAARQRRDAQRRASDDLREAKAAQRARDLVRADQMARRVVDNQDAKSADRRAAQRILDAVESARQRESRATPGGVTPTVGGLTSMGGPRGSRPTTPRSSSGDQVGKLRTRPDHDDQVAVWFHDDTVQAGKTYRYRTRVRLWNRYVGDSAALKDPQQAGRSVLTGEWSLPSGAITVAPSTHFFVTGTTLTKDGARIGIWKWRRGEWIRGKFDVQVGDVIGGVSKVKTGERDEDRKEKREDIDFTTGAIVLDLRFNEPVITRSGAGKAGEFKLRKTDSLVMVYLDPADGQVKQRVQVLDRYDPLHLKLKETD